MEFEMILEISNAGDQAFLKSLLDAEDVDYYIQGECAAPYFYHALPMRLMVRKEQAAMVRELLKDFVGASAYAGLK
jgi:hypothetical protein